MSINGSIDATKGPKSEIDGPGTGEPGAPVVKSVSAPNKESFCTLNPQLIIRPE